MKPISSDAFRRLALRGNEILADVPLQDAWRVELPGGPDGLTMRQIDEVVFFGNAGSKDVGLPTRALFWLRGALGRIFRWDTEYEAAPSSYLDRLTEADLARSETPPGMRRGIQRLLYTFENESLAEITNRTVQAFVLTALERTPAGYALSIGIFVRPTSWFTPVYMAMIGPFRHWIVYPAMGRSIQRAWERGPLARPRSRDAGSG